MFPATSQKTEEIDDTDTDGEDPGDTDISTVLIEVASNGYMITITLDDGTEEKSVHTDFDEVLTIIRGRH